MKQIRVIGKLTVRDIDLVITPSPPIEIPFGSPWRSNRNITN